MGTDEPIRTRIEDGQPLVRSLAVKISRAIPVRVDLDDLVAYGQIGLAEAARDYDPQRGVQFSTFAYYRIRGAIYDGISKMSWTSRARYNRMRYEQLANETLREMREAYPSSPAASLEEEAAWLRGVVERLAVVYLTSASGGLPGEDIEDPGLPPPAMAESREIGLKLRALVDELPPVERRLVHTVYFEGASLQQAADRLGISKSWASRLHAKSLELLAVRLRRLGVG
jgi:RNA polymerase sigma factor for flagellar operon FliA